MEKFIGKWKLETSENFDEYMKALGVGMVLRKVASTLKPDLVFSQEGDQIKMRTESTFKTTEITFKLGVEIEEETADGRKVKTTVTMDGNKMIQAQKGDPDSTLTREIKDDNTLELICKAKDVESKRTYSRVTES